MSVVDSRLEMTGRRKHLGDIALVFKHRGATWLDFGQFLKGLFEGQGSGAVEVRCRHNSGGLHHGVLADALRDPAAYPMFDHERYGRPCIAIGTWEEGKNPGLVVADLCAKAAAFISSLDRDGDFRMTDQSPSLSPVDSDESIVYDSQESLNNAVPESQEAQGAIDGRNIVDGPRVTSAAGPVVDEDIADAMEVLDSQETAESVDTPSGYRASQDSILQRNRVSTKMRAATLGYLWQFADHPEKLKAKFQRLRRDPSLHVLHLCGDGICSIEGGRRVPGCCERSHLVLGTSVNNEAHAAWHKTMKLARVEDYSLYCGIAHGVASGAGLF
ncbi:hypothetical protein V8C26DRAFT_417977 [Trichoderma gracile]